MVTVSPSATVAGLKLLIAGRATTLIVLNARPLPSNTMSTSFSPRLTSRGTLNVTLDGDTATKLLLVMTSSPINTLATLSISVPLMLSSAPGPVTSLLKPVTFELTSCTEKVIASSLLQPMVIAANNAGMSNIDITLFILFIIVLPNFNIRDFDSQQDY